MSTRQRADGAGEPDLEELPTAEEIAAWRRVQAGLLAEQGLLDPAWAATWQERVREREFDADELARAVQAEGVPPEAKAATIERTRTLARDLVMAPLTRGVRGAGRGARRKAKGALALLVSQIYLLIVWGGLLFAAVLLLRLRGWEFDPFLDRVLSLFHDS